MVNTCTKGTSYEFYVACKSYQNDHIQEMSGFSFQFECLPSKESLIGTDRNKF